MPIINIGNQPGHETLPMVHAAYRPLRFIVRAKATEGHRLPPVVYCDIYFNGTFYKTKSATQYWYLWSEFSDFEFDISDAAQEYLSFNLPGNGGSTIGTAPLAIVSAFCRFRSSGYDSNRFIIPEGVAPKQATGSKPAVAGTGTESFSFQILNAVLQHEDNQNLQTHLQYFRPNGNWDNDTYPLTHRPNGYKVCPGDSDHYPILHIGNKVMRKIRLRRRAKNGNELLFTYSIPQTCASVVSSLSAVVQAGNDVNVSFNSSGPATLWEWTISGGETWTTVNTKSFSISWEDLLTILITEVGEEIITEDGEIIIPEDVEVFGEYELTVRPRCSNGAYGTSATTTYEITEIEVCPFPTLALASKNETAGTITLNIGMPSGRDDYQLEWKFDYGNGFITNAAQQQLTNITSPYVWSAPPRANTGTYKIRIRTKCETDNYSEWTSWLDVAWAKPSSQVAVGIDNIAALSSGRWRVFVSLSSAVADNVIVQGYFQGDGEGGVLETFNFTCVIQAGSTAGTTTVPGAEPGGNYVSGSGKITSASPDPTSDGKDLTY